MQLNSQSLVWPVSCDAAFYQIQFKLLWSRTRHVTLLMTRQHQHRLVDKTEFLSRINLGHIASCERMPTKLDHSHEILMLCRHQQLGQMIKYICWVWMIFWLSMIVSGKINAARVFRWSEASKDSFQHPINWWLMIDLPVYFKHYQPLDDSSVLQQHSTFQMEQFKYFREMQIFFVEAVLKYAWRHPSKLSHQNSNWFQLILYFQVEYFW